MDLLSCVQNENSKNTDEFTCVRPGNLRSLATNPRKYLYPEVRETYLCSLHLEAESFCPSLSMPLSLRPRAQIYLNERESLKVWHSLFQETLTDETSFRKVLLQLMNLKVKI
jgi:hypothetical protein